MNGRRDIALADACSLFVDGDWIETKDQAPTGIRLIQTGNVGCGVFKDRAEKARYISDETFQRLKCQEVLPGDCLISRLPDPVGRACLIPDIGERAITAVDCTIIRFKGGVIVPEFFLYYTQSRDYTLAVASACTGATRNRISRTNLGRIRIPALSIDEQKRIVAVLHEAFEAIARAITNAEQNAANTEELLASYLNAVFDHRGDTKTAASKRVAGSLPPLATASSYTAAKPHKPAGATSGVTKTGGRAATTRHIPGNLSLCVGMPTSPARNGWRWSLLADMARLESGHTPSRRRPEYWGGKISWISIKDAKRAHGREVFDTLEHTNKLGIQNSSARVLPKGTVCLSRTASVGYTFVLAKPMATSQDFVNWVCSEEIDPHFVKYLFMAQGADILKFASGAIHQTIYFPEAKAFCVCHPAVGEQRQIVAHADFLRDESERLGAIYRKKLDALSHLKLSLLQKAFRSELPLLNTAQNVIAIPRSIQGITTTDLHAGVLALAYQRHEDKGQTATFGRVKGEKIAHLVEAIAGIDLGRTPIKNAAGPSDHPRTLKVEHRARKAGYFSVAQARQREGYTFRKLNRFDEAIRKTRRALGQHSADVDRIIDLIVPMDTRQAEILATLYAAWNNLLADGREATDEEIVLEARENWHPDKLQIERERFLAAIKWMKEKGIVPRGDGKRVEKRTSA